MFCIIGHCDYQEDHTDIADKIDDYLWIKLCQVQTDSAAGDRADVLTLQKLQTLLYEEYGNKFYWRHGNDRIFYNFLQQLVQSS